MNPRIQHLINHPFEVQLSDVALLQDQIAQYPYFSILRSLLLFALKESEHESYHTELKKTSIYSPSRVALYHYLQKEKQAPTWVETETPTETMVSEEFTEPEVQPMPIQEENIPQDSPEDKTMPAEATVDSAHTELTFSQWLHLSKSEKGTEEKRSEKDIKFQLIDEFIEKSPKISPVRNPEPESQSGKIGHSNEYSDLMTETLAQIYTEQKKYDKAVRAYKILSLKYPEKSIFFADRINEIEILKNKK